jgi:hypothetical protein
VAAFPRRAWERSLSPHLPHPDRSHAPRGNASRDAPRSSFTLGDRLKTAMTRSVSGCIPTQSVGTIFISTSAHPDRSHAPRGNASRDAPRSSLTIIDKVKTAMTRSVSGCIPTQSVGTIFISTSAHPDRSHAPRGNVSRDAPRSSFTLGDRLKTAMTRSVSGCITTQSVGTSFGPG